MPYGNFIGYDTIVSHDNRNNLQAKLLSTYMPKMYIIS